MSAAVNGGGSVITNDPAQTGLVPPPDPEDWTDFVLGLRRLAEIDRNRVDDPELPRGYAGVLGAMHHIRQFLTRQPALAAADLVPTQRLYGALLDLGRGTVSPVFKPPSRTHGNGCNFDIIKGTAARAMGESMDAGESLEEAARGVAQALAGLRGRGTITWQTVKGWRDRLNQGPGPGAPDAALFAYQRPLPPELGSTSRERADNLLADLRRTAAGRV